MTLNLLPSWTRRTATNAQLHCQDAHCTCGLSIAEEAKRITAASFLHTSEKCARFSLLCENKKRT